MKNILNNNKDFLVKLITIASPIVIQNFITSSLNFLDLFMIGQLGENEIAAVGIGSQVYFIYQMFIFSLASGVSIFVAQYWGRKEIKNVYRILGIGLSFIFSIATIFTLIVLMLTNEIASIYSDNIEVIELSSAYMRIISLSFIIYGISYLYSSILKSTENVRFPVIASLIAILTNSILNYFLIYGKLCFPKLGVSGAAIATVISRILEFTILITGSYIKKYPTIAPFKIIFDFTKTDVIEYSRKTIPIIGQCMGWTLGSNMYSVIYSNMSIEAFASYNIAISVQNICLTIFTSLGIACSIMVGNKIGANENDRARNYSVNFIAISVLLSLIISLMVIQLRVYIVGFYNLDDITKEYLYRLLLVIAGFLMVRAVNIIFMIGILKAGGDTMFSMLVDVGGIWIVGVPLAAFFAFYLRLNVYYVMAYAGIEEIVKMFTCSYRFFKNRWLKSLTLQGNLPKNN